MLLVDLSRLGPDPVRFLNPSPRRGDHCLKAFSPSQPRPWLCATRPAAREHAGLVELLPDT